MKHLITFLLSIVLVAGQNGICMGEKDIVNKHQKIVFAILAGGSGSRLWPLSSPDKPKQFIPFLDSPTMLELTIKRIAPLAHSNQDIMVVTHERYHQAVTDFAGASIGRIMTEPLARNTGPAFLQVLCELSKRDDDPVIIMLPSDHFIPDQGLFLALLAQVHDLVAQEPYLAILGARPTRPATGYGYIQAQSDKASKTYLPVQQFHEKPSEQMAQKYLEAGNYFWNMGIVLGRCSTFMHEFKRYAPELLQAFTSARTIQEAYTSVPSISLDVALLEKSKSLVVFPWSYEWYDVGNIQTYLELHQRFAALKPEQQIIAIKSDNNLISSRKKIVACVGVSNICVVETNDALLIVANKDVEEVRKVSESLTKQSKAFECS